jgi:hypothetical protein
VSRTTHTCESVQTVVRTVQNRLIQLQVVKIWLRFDLSVFFPSENCDFAVNFSGAIFPCVGAPVGSDSFNEELILWGRINFVFWVVCFSSFPLHASKNNSSSV